MVTISALTDLFNIREMKCLLNFEPLDMQLICTITPATSNNEETHNTLKFAHRAKRIEIHAASNRVQTIFCGGGLLDFFLVPGLNLLAVILCCYEMLLPCVGLWRNLVSYLHLDLPFRVKAKSISFTKCENQEIFSET